MKKWIPFITVIALVFGFIVVMISLIYKTTNSYENIVKANWGVIMQKSAGFKEVYKKTSEASFNGDGIRYHVFSYEHEEYVENMLGWGNDEQKTIFYSSVDETAKRWLSDISVPLDECPDFSKCVYWYEKQIDNSEILVFWNSEADRIYIVEEFL